MSDYRLRAKKFAQFYSLTHGHVNLDLQNNFTHDENRRSNNLNKRFKPCDHKMMKTKLKPD